jgi:drug/metabolite transporter (DMT)-like permease
VEGKIRKRSLGEGGEGAFFPRCFAWRTREYMAIQERAARGARPAAPSRMAAPGAQATAPVPGRGWTEASLALMVLVWAVNFSVVKWALATFDPLGFNALRFVLASVFVYAVLRWQGPLRLPARRDMLRLALLGMVGNVLYQMGFIFGLDLTRAGNASVVMALTPLFIALLSWRVGHEQPGRLTWFGGACSVLGVALVSRTALALEGSSALLGDLILVGAGITWACYTVGARSLIERYGSVQVTAWTLWAGTLPLVLFGVPSLRAQPWGEVSVAAWGGLLFSAFLSIGLAYLLWYRGVERLGNTRTSIYSNLTPAVALVVAAVWLGEQLTVFSVIGAAMTIGGVMLVRQDKRGAAPKGGGKTGDRLLPAEV